MDPEIFDDDDQGWSLLNPYVGVVVLKIFEGGPRLHVGGEKVHPVTTYFKRLTLKYIFASCHSHEVLIVNLNLDYGL